MGATPELLAWSIAAGLVIGINPLLGSTTLLCFALASLFRLNIAASQLANHIVYPLQVLLVIPFIRLGSRLFHTAPMPFSAARLLHEARMNPLALTRQLWLWEFHALIVWMIGALLFVPPIALALTPILRHVMGRIERRQYPIVPST